MSHAKGGETSASRLARVWYVFGMYSDLDIHRLSSPRDHRVVFLAGVPVLASVVVVLVSGAAGLTCLLLVTVCCRDGVP